MGSGLNNCNTSQERVPSIARPAALKGLSALPNSPWKLNRSGRRSWPGRSLTKVRARREKSDGSLFVVPPSGGGCFPCDRKGAAMHRIADAPWRVPSLPHYGQKPMLIGIMKSSKQLGGWVGLGFLYMAGEAMGVTSSNTNYFPSNDRMEKRKTAPVRKRFETGRAGSNGGGMK